MLVEHALLASGDIAESGAIYAGWPARQLDQRKASEITMVDHSASMEKQSSTATKLTTEKVNQPEP